uniref:putative nuclease HARBI1 n=1 Tax=Erigeron canadensis TaxID=72917 RepID=UPI001CB9B52A|nr:putative nuclease HARBI1 [Erigeron canadensis]
MTTLQHLAAIHLVCVVAVFIVHRRFRSSYRLRDRDMMVNGKNVRKELFHYLSISGSYRKHIRMSENAFNILCHKLKNKGGLRPTQQRDSRQQEIYPFYKDCIGAIDGTHVCVRVSNKDAPRFRGRKGYPTINALVACTFDLKFTYVLSGWEGTASDSRIIKDALSRDDKLVIPDGKFYLVDGGLPNRSTLIAPYRGVRYHLKEYSSRAPQNTRELFNLRHASLRNAIERAFGVLKKRFAIIRSSNEPFYPPETQSDIFLSCCILHNFLLEVDRDKELEDEVACEVLDA